MLKYRKADSNWMLGEKKNILKRMAAGHVMAVGALPWGVPRRPLGDRRPDDSGWLPEQGKGSPALWGSTKALLLASFLQIIPEPLASLCQTAGPERLI